MTMSVGDPLRKVRSGEKLVITADAWNAMIDVVNSFRLQQTSPIDRTRGYRETIVRAKNGTGGALDIFSVVALNWIGYASTGDAESATIWQAEKPGWSASDPLQNFIGILLDPLPDDGRFVRVGVAGAFPVKIDSDGYAPNLFDGYCDAETDNTGNLKQMRGGRFQIVGHNFIVADSTPFAIVELGQRPPHQLSAAMLSRDGAHDLLSTPDFIMGETTAILSATPFTATFDGAPYKSGLSLIALGGDDKTARLCTIGGGGTAGAFLLSLNNPLGGSDDTNPYLKWIPAPTGYSGNVIVRDAAGTGTTTLTFSDGLLTAVT